MRWLNGSARRGLKLVACLATAGAAQADTAYVTCQSSEEVAVIDLGRGETLSVWPMPGKPAGVSAAVPGEVFTVAPEAKTVRRLDAGGTVLASAEFDGGPTGIAVDAERRRLFVSDWFNARLWVLDATTLEMLGELATGSSPAGIALSDDGRFLASADKDSDQVSLFDAETMKPLAAIKVGTRPYGLAFSPDGRLFVGNVGTNDVSVIDPKAQEVLATVPVGDRPYGVAFAQGRAFVTNQYANTVSVIALDTLEPVGTIDAGDYPEGIDATQDGRAVVLANWFDNTLMVIDANSLDVIDTIDTCDGPRGFGRFLSPGGS